jgi:hypothetical protein
MNEPVLPARLGTDDRRPSPQRYSRLGRHPPCSWRRRHEQPFRAISRRAAAVSGAPRLRRGSAAPWSAHRAQGPSPPGEDVVTGGGQRGRVPSACRDECEDLGGRAAGSPGAGHSRRPRLPGRRRFRVRSQVESPVGGERRGWHPVTNRVPPARNRDGAAPLPRQRRTTAHGRSGRHRPRAGRGARRPRRVEDRTVGQALGSRRRVGRLVQQLAYRDRRRP